MRMSLIQYISSTHTSKDMAKEHKRKCNTFHNIYLKDATFDEIVELLDVGCSIGRVENTTDFLTLDIDQTSIDINTVIEHYKDSKDIAVCYGASNNDKKYHILINLHRTITCEEYKEVAIEEFTKIRAELCDASNFMVLDDAANKFYQCFFGASVTEEREYILQNSTRLNKWINKDDKPNYYTDKSVIHPSLNSADYCRKHGLLTVKEEKRFDIYLPSMTHGKMKLIAVGHRYDWSKMIGAKLMMRVFYLNHDFKEGWTKIDYLTTLDWIVKTNVVMSDEFCKSADYKGLVRFFDNKWDILCDKPYDVICSILEPYFDSTKRQYKSRQYNPTIMSNILTEHMIDANTIHFTNKNELQSICKSLLIDYYRFTTFVKNNNFTITFDEISDSRIRYDVNGMTKEEFDQYCTNNNINKVTKSRLKKKYDIK